MSQVLLFLSILFSPSHLFAGFNEIVEAIRNCRADVVKVELEKLSNKEEIHRKIEGKTLLHLLFENVDCNEWQKLWIAKSLIKADESLIDEADDRGNPPVFSALIRNSGSPTSDPKQNPNLLAVRRLVQAGSSVVNQRGESLAQEAIAYGDIDLFTFLKVEYGDLVKSGLLTRQVLQGSLSIFQQVYEGKLKLDGPGYCSEEDLEKSVNWDSLSRKLDHSTKTLLLGCGNEGKDGFLEADCKNNAAHRQSHVCVNNDASVLPDIHFDVNELASILNALGLPHHFDEIKSEQCCPVSRAVDSLSFTQIFKIVRTLKCGAKPGGLIEIQMCCRHMGGSRLGEVSPVFEEMMKMSGFVREKHLIVERLSETTREIQGPQTQRLDERTQDERIIYRNE